MNLQITAVDYRRVLPAEGVVVPARRGGGAPVNVPIQRKAQGAHVIPANNTREARLDT